MMLNTVLRPLCFFSVLDERAHYQKNVFFMSCARIRLLPISREKQSVSGDKKKHSSLPFFKIGQKVFLFRRPHRPY